ncbi:MAG: hypothetical protein V2I34_09775 [Bacteroidales bacterium]|jgi:hypothetical protein|nr:hypothetical protein [Bacteroidales bacterium]
MKRIIIICSLLFVLSFLLVGQKPSNPSYRYYANPGFVNITELHYGEGIIISELDITNPNRYAGITNVFAYQANRNFLGGIGLGYFQFDKGQLFPVFLEYRYSIYLRAFTPYFFADGGGLLSVSDFLNDSKIFINPGFGVSRYISKNLELNLSAGFSVQSRATITSIAVLNFKLGITYRKNPYRMLKADNNNYYF